MSNLDEILKFLSEQDQDKSSSESDRDDKDLGLLKTIWEQSSEVAGYQQFDSAEAWEKVTGSTEAPRLIRMVSIQTVLAAAAIFLLVVVATRFLIPQGSEEVPFRSFASFNDAYDYASANLFDLAEEVMGSAKSEVFTSRVIEMAGERFDGETNVLVRNVLASDASSRKWQGHLSAFQNIEGDNYYPQIYIPDYEDYDEKSGEPVVVIHVSDQPTRDGDFIYDAFKLNEKGRLSFYRRVTEADVDRERIWVFSLNENVDNDGRLRSNLASVSSKPGRLSSRIDKMQIRNPKESWAGGASEVSIRAFLEYWNGVNFRGEAVDVPCDRTTFSSRGLRVRNFTREEILDDKVVEIDYLLHDNWDADEFLQDEVAYAFVLFESDVWPNMEKSATFSLPNGDTREIRYFSAEEHFDVEVIYGAPSPPGWYSRIYPNGIPQELLIDRFIREDDPDIYYNNEIY